MESEQPLVQYPKLSEQVSAGISALKERLKQLEIPLKGSVVTGVVVLVEKLSSHVAFNCPEKYYRLYGLLFMFCPVLVFFCLALMLSKSFWKIVSRCGKLPQNQQRMIWRRSRKFVYLCSIPPIIWIIFVFIDADYYVCARLGPLEPQLNRTEPSLQPLVLAEFDQVRAESQVIALVLISFVFVISTILLSLDRCCTKADAAVSGEEEYIHYMGEEAVTLFNSRLKPMAKQEAKEHLEALFEKYKDVDDAAKRIRLVAKEINNQFPWVAKMIAPE